jgi:hypothetical protein
MSKLNGRKRGGGKVMAMPNIRISHPDWQRESSCQLDQKSNNTIFVQSLMIHMLQTVYP